MQVFELVVSIEGGPEKFVAIGDDELWCAWGERDGSTVTIAARGVPLSDVALRSAVVDEHLEAPDPPAA